jgi:hypothetical protein
MLDRMQRAPKGTNRTAAAFLCVMGFSAAQAAAAAECPKRIADKPDPDLEMVANVLVVYEGCSIGDAGFATKFRPVYQAWREKYRDAILRYERNPNARHYVQCGLDHEKRRSAADTPAGRSEKAQMCDQVIGPGIQRFIDHGPR